MMKTKIGKIIDWTVLTVTIIYDMVVAFVFGSYAIALMDSNFYINCDFVTRNIFMIILVLLFNVVQFAIRVWIRTYKK